MSGPAWIEGLSFLGVILVLVPVAVRLVREVAAVEERVGDEAGQAKGQAPPRGFGARPFGEELERSNPAWHRGARRRPASAFERPATSRCSRLHRGIVAGGTGLREP